MGAGMENLWKSTIVSIECHSFFKKIFMVTIQSTARPVIFWGWKTLNFLQKCTILGVCVLVGGLVFVLEYWSYINPLDAGWNPHCSLLKGSGYPKMDSRENWFLNHAILGCPIFAQVQIVSPGRSTTGASVHGRVSNKDSWIQSATCAKLLVESSKVSIPNVVRAQWWKSIQKGFIIIHNPSSMCYGMAQESSPPRATSRPLVLSSMVFWKIHHYRWCSQL